MKISKKRLTKLIESYLKEQDTPLGSLSLVVYREFHPYKEVILDLLMPYDAAKREAGLRDCDKYFHYLAFMNAAANIQIDNEELQRKFDVIGNSKELLDAINPFGSTPITKVGYAASMAEWKKDIESNQEGMQAGLSIRVGGDPGEFLNRAYSKLVHTPKDIAITSKTLSFSDSLKKLKESYGWAWDQHPDFYADDKVFIQPRYNIKLSPNERLAAWKRRDGTIPPFVKDLTGPLLTV